MKKIKLIPTGKATSENVVTLIKELLALAEAGEIGAFGYVTVPTDTSYAPAHGYTYDTPHDWYGLVAAASYFLYRLNRNSDEL